MKSIARIALFTAIGLAGPVIAEMPQVDLPRAEEIHMGRCFLCHGAEGESSTALYPRLAGQHYQYIAKQLADFKSGRRRSDTMTSMAVELTPEEMQALGVFFERKPARVQEAQDGELAAVGRFVFRRGNEYSGVPACATCHGDKGLGTAQLPRLAGQIPQYIESQLRSFNKRERTNDNAVMHSIASKLTDLEMKAVAVYISTLHE